MRDAARTSRDRITLTDHFIRARFRYRPEHEEVIRTPDFMLDQLETEGFIEGDCDDITTLYATLLHAMHIPVRLVAIRYNPDDAEYRHVFLEAFDGSGWRRLDATVPAGTVHREVERMTEYVQ